MFCKDRFYGPIKHGLHSTRHFYISVLSAAKFVQPDITGLSVADEVGYAFMLETDLDSCLKGLVNLGTRVHSVNVGQSTGWTVRYDYGSICEGTTEYSTTIQFVCDKSVGDGWPTYLHTTS
jgi:hypothetical protein